MNESIKLVQNPDYWKKGLPYLDGIEFTIIPDRATRMLAFISRQVRHDLPDRRHGAAAQEHQGTTRPRRSAPCARAASASNLIINREAPPFDNPKIRRALALTLDRKAFIDILSEGEDKPSGIMLPPPDGVWGMPAGDAEGPAGLRRRRQGARGGARS